MKRARETLRGEPNPDGEISGPIPIRRAAKGRLTEYQRVEPDEVLRAERAFQANPDDPEAEFLLAYLLYAARRYNAARRHFTALVEKDFRVAELRFHLGSCLYQLGRKQDARKEWERCLEEDPDEELTRLIRRRLGWFRHRGDGASS